MKTLIASLACCLLGVAVGWYAGRSHSKQETTQAIQQMMETIESHERLETASAIRLIELIQSGDTQVATHVLSRPIADFYLLYAHRTGESTLKLIAQIEQLRKT